MLYDMLLYYMIHHPRRSRRRHQCLKKHTPPEKQTLGKTDLKDTEIRGWRGVSPAAPCGKDSCKRSVFLQAGRDGGGDTVGEIGAAHDVTVRSRCLFLPCQLIL